MKKLLIALTLVASTTVAQTNDAQQVDSMRTRLVNDGAITLSDLDFVSTAVAPDDVSAARVRQLAAVLGEKQIAKVHLKVIVRDGQDARAARMHSKRATSKLIDALVELGVDRQELVAEEPTSEDMKEGRTRDRVVISVEITEPEAQS